MPIDTLKIHLKTSLSNGLEEGDMSLSAKEISSDKDISLVANQPLPFPNEPDINEEFGWMKERICRWLNRCDELFETENATMIGKLPRLSDQHLIAHKSTSDYLINEGEYILEDLQRIGLTLKEGPEMIGSKDLEVTLTLLNEGRRAVHEPSDPLERESFFSEITKIDH